MTDNTPIEVTQADRDMAKAASKDIYYANSHQMCEADAEEMEGVLCQHFARHRTQSTPRLADDGLAKEAEAIWNDALWHFNPDWKTEDGFEGSRDRAIDSIRRALELHDHVSSLRASEPVGEREALELRAARAAGNIPAPKPEPGR